MFSRCLAKMPLQCLLVSSSGSCESSHLKFWRNASRSSALLFGLSFWISSSSLISLNVRLWISGCGYKGTWIVWFGGPEVLIVWRFVGSFQKFVDVNYCVFWIVLSEHFKCCRIEWFEFFCFFWWQDFEFATVVFFLMVYGVGVVLVTLTSISRFETADIELATTRGSTLQWLVAGLMTPDVSTVDDISV